MPKAEGNVVCVNHPRAGMHRLGTFEVHKLDPAEDDPTPTAKIRLYKCLNCGYIELYEHKVLDDEIMGAVGRK